MSLDSILGFFTSSAEEKVSLSCGLFGFDIVERFNVEAGIKS
jgi:hypothetical protein